MVINEYTFILRFKLGGGKGVLGALLALTEQGGWGLLGGGSDKGRHLGVAGFDIGFDTALTKRGGHDGTYGRGYGLGLHRLIHLPGEAGIRGDFH